MIKSARRITLCVFIATAIGCQPTAQVSPSSTSVNEKPATPISPTTSVIPTISASPKLGHDDSPVPDKFTLVRYPENNGSLTRLLRAEAQRAVGAKRRPYVEFYADWCAPCQALRHSLTDRRMIEAFANTYLI